MAGRVAGAFRASYTCWPGWALTHKGRQSPWQTRVLFVCPQTHVVHTPNSTRIHCAHTLNMPVICTTLPHTYHTHMHTCYVTTVPTAPHVHVDTHTYSATRISHTEHIYPTTHKHTTDTPHWSHASMPHTRVYTHLISHSPHTSRRHHAHHTCTMYSLNNISNYTHTHLLHITSIHAHTSHTRQNTHTQHIPHTSPVHRSSRESLLHTHTPRHPAWLLSPSARRGCSLGLRPGGTVVTRGREGLVAVARDVSPSGRAGSRRQSRGSARLLRAHVRAPPGACVPRPSGGCVRGQRGPRVGRDCACEKTLLPVSQEPAHWASGRACPQRAQPSAECGPVCRRGVCGRGVCVGTECGKCSWKLACV